ncbi:MAG: PVC-type heme-binding CxxCH protein, partial [Phycisphaeraceae bacterium]
MFPIKWLTLFAMVAAAATPAFAQRHLTDIPEPDAQQQKEMLRLDDNLEVNLFASDPDIAKPIQMNWDPQGRLWVATSSVYPQIRPGEVANDKIIVLEDTTGDGKADKSTVFADGLLIPTGVAYGHGGVYVANSTELLHLKDTDGDGKADHRRVVLSGFGTEDTHHIIHTFRWGPDGSLYFNQSIYIHSHVETPWGPRRLLAGGIWRLRPDDLKLEVYSRGWVNAWGHVFDKWGQSFVTDGAGGEGINYTFPGAAFVTARGAPRVLRGLNPGQPKHSGLGVVSGRHFPESWQGNLITNDFRGNRINRFVISESGSGYVSRQTQDPLTTSHIAFRPVDAQMGPDGALYIADWYNPIIQHGEVDFRDERRDREHGRIWRITYKDRPIVQPPQLIGVPVEDVLDALKQPEGWTRQQAKRVLAESPAEEVIPALNSWVQGLDAEHDDYALHLLEALWVHQSLDVVNAELLERVLDLPHAGARAAAVRVLGTWHASHNNAERLLDRAVQDDHARVRLEAVNALRKLDSAEAARLAMKALDRDVDRFLDYAIWLTARELKAHWLPALREDP